MGAQVGASGVGASSGRGQIKGDQSARRLGHVARGLGWGKLSSGAPFFPGVDEAVAQEGHGRDERENGQVQQGEGSS
jgi:hypothetical protein